MNRKGSNRLKYCLLKPLSITFFCFVNYPINAKLSFCKFLSFVAPIIKNKSMIAQIPNPPQVNNLAIPVPVSPIMNRSIPKDPPNMETIKETVGSLNSRNCMLFHLELSNLKSASFILGKT